MWQTSLVPRLSVQHAQPSSLLTGGGGGGGLAEGLGTRLVANKCGSPG